MRTKYERVVTGGAGSQNSTTERSLGEDSRSEKTGTVSSSRNRRRVFASYIEASIATERDLKPSTLSWTKMSSPGNANSAFASCPEEAPASVRYALRSL